MSSQERERTADRLIRMLPLSDFELTLIETWRSMERAAAAARDALDSGRETDLPGIAELNERAAEFMSYIGDFDDLLWEGV